MLGAVLVVDGIKLVKWVNSDPSPKRYVLILISEICDCDLIWKKDFCRCVKDLKMRSSWITWEGPKSNDNCPYQRLKRRQKRTRPCKDQGRNDVAGKGKLEKARNNSSFRGSMAWPTP